MKTPCPVIGCSRCAGSRKLMCARCWSAVPPDVQRRVHSTYRAWLRDLGDVEKLADYKAAAAEAIEAV